MKKRVAIAGATGYSGAELSALLARHPHVEVSSVHSTAASEGVAFSALHPSLRNVDGPEVTALSLETLLASAPDTVFLATPNELSAEIVPALVGEGITTIDLSGSFRLRDGALYPKYYGFEHPAAELLGSAVYGLTEWCNGSLEGAKLVANPGCYPTSILLALKPLANMIAAGSTVVCDSKSGVSGAGKKASLDYSLTELSGNFMAYSVDGHRHQPEIAGEIGSDSVRILFVPHLLPIPRGILSTMYVNFDEPVEPEALASTYEKAYARAPFVHVLDHGSLPALRNVVGTPHCEIGFRVLEGGRQAVVVSVIDNLLKGAASQAVQNFNRVHGFDETEGLS